MRINIKNWERVCVKRKSEGKVNYWTCNREDIKSKEIHKLITDFCFSIIGGTSVVGSGIKSVVFAEEDGEILGGITLFYDYSQFGANINYYENGQESKISYDQLYHQLGRGNEPVATIDAIAVNQNLKGSGIAKKLVAILEEAVKEEKKAKLIVLTKITGGPRVFKFFWKCGFTKISIYSFYETGKKMSCRNEKLRPLLLDYFFRINSNKKLDIQQGKSINYSDVAPFGYIEHDTFYEQKFGAREDAVQPVKNIYKPMKIIILGNDVYPAKKELLQLKKRFDDLF